MRVPQAMSTRAARALTGEATTAVSALAATFGEAGAEAVTGAGVGLWARVAATEPTPIRAAAAAADTPATRARRRRWRRTARAREASSVCGRGSAGALSCSIAT